MQKGCIGNQNFIDKVADNSFEMTVRKQGVALVPFRQSSICLANGVYYYSHGILLLISIIKSLTFLSVQTAAHFTILTQPYLVKSSTQANYSNVHTFILNHNQSILVCNILYKLKSLMWLSIAEQTY